MKLLEAIRNPFFSLGVNLTYAVGNCVIGFLSHSWWFITVGAYYAVLSSARFCVLKTAQRSGAHPETEAFAKRTTGCLLIALSICLVGINILSAVKDRGTAFHEIIMIAIAVYSFAKLTMAIIGMAKAKRCSAQFITILRNISLADGVVSIYTLQRSMLVSFPGMEAHEIQLFNTLTGTAVWFIVLLLGLNLIGGKHINMATSKIAKINHKIAEAVSDGYRKIEHGVVDGYKKIEQGVVDGYTKMEDKFVDAYLTRDGETVEEAKARLKKENK